VGRTISPAAKAGFEAVDGGRLFFEVAGSGSPVVLIHSGITDSRSWDPQVGPIMHDVAHVPNMERPAEFNQLVLDFLSEHAS
jgi:pimeloyl-ACP methyl ester carboxylesterase